MVGKKQAVIPRIGYWIDFINKQHATVNFFRKVKYKKLYNTFYNVQNNG
jgi:hypothetical protein